MEPLIKVEMDTKEITSYITEIQLMMYGLGDNPRPLLSTASLVEKIVLQQLILLIGQAEEVSEKRGADGIYPQDILFLMRKDVAMLNRIMTYVSIKEVKKSFVSLTSGDGGSSNLEEDNKPIIFESKRRILCEEFLQNLGVKLGQSYDSSMQERLLRMDKRVQNMPNKILNQYEKARQTAFATSQSSQTKFLDWVRQANPETALAVAKFKSFTVDMLVYLAKETIARIIDLALLLRQEAKVHPTHPLSWADPPPHGLFYSSIIHVVEGPPAITCDEVREVLRRFYSPQLNPWSLFSTYTDIQDTFNQIISC